MPGDGIGKTVLPEAINVFKCRKLKPIISMPISAGNFGAGKEMHSRIGQ
jgi:isocitrate/isopropylmalate dehydrogenase